MTTLIEGGIVVTLGRDNKVISPGGVVIEGEAIKDIGPLEDLKIKYSNADVLDAKEKIIMPEVITTADAERLISGDHWEVWFGLPDEYSFEETPARDGRTALMANSDKVYIWVPPSTKENLKISPDAGRYGFYAFSFP